jgi:hypothetical protein
MRSLFAGLCLQRFQPGNYGYSDSIRRWMNCYSYAVSDDFPAIARSRYPKVAAFSALLVLILNRSPWMSGRASLTAMLGLAKSDVVYGQNLAQ